MKDLGNKTNFGKQRDNKLKYILPSNSKNKIRTKIYKDTFPKVLNKKSQKEQN